MLGQEVTLSVPRANALPLADAVAETGTEFGDSALSEIGNILGASYMTALGSITGLTLNLAPPQLVTDLLASIVASLLAEAARENETALVLART